MQPRSKTVTPVGDADVALEALLSCLTGPDGIALLPLHNAPGGVCTCRRTDCRTPGKHPRTMNGKDDASTDPAKIGDWFELWPGCNWGGRPGVGQIVLDIDPRNGGNATFGKRCAELGVLPDTATARTGSGGLHYWLGHEGGHRGNLGPGLDVKGHKGYVVLPGSRHACGGLYEWIAGSSIAPASPSWSKALTPIERVFTGKTADLSGLIIAVVSAPEGTRNSLLFWAANRAVEAGLDPTPLADAARAVGLEPDEINRAISNAVRTSSPKDDK